MAALQCVQCATCHQCRYSSAHMRECNMVYTEILVSMIKAHEDAKHPRATVDMNDIEIMREFRSIVEPQVNDVAAEILDAWLVGRMKVDELPNEIPKLWREVK